MLTYVLALGTLTKIVMFTLTSLAARHKARHLTRCFGAGEEGFGFGSIELSNMIYQDIYNAATQASMMITAAYASAGMNATYHSTVFTIFRGRSDKVQWSRAAPKSWIDLGLSGERATFKRKGLLSKRLIFIQQLPDIAVKLWLKISIVAHRFDTLMVEGGYANLVAAIGMGFITLIPVAASQIDPVKEALPLLDAFSQVSLKKIFWTNSARAREDVSILALFVFTIFLVLALFTKFCGIWLCESHVYQIFHVSCAEKNRLG